MNRKLKRRCLQELRQTFQVESFRPGQKAAASCLLSGRDLLCVLPTGAGKSLCWQLPAAVHPGITVVVTPLIALMQDQLRRLQEKGIAAVALHSLMTRQELYQAEAAIRRGEMKVVFAAPERLDSGAFRNLMQAAPPWLVVVDEAHCIVEWGGEFRPAYRQIGAFISALPQRPVVCAMTATADARMQQQIVESLRMGFVKRVMLPVLRPNLHYRVITTTANTQEILRITGSRPVRTVIFCRSRRRTEQLAALLRQAGLSAEHYHAGLTREERTAVQARFSAGQTTLLAATTAFGMGIDIPDIRRVIHDSLPESVTELVQQSGRAGRDGQPADCVILLHPADLIRRGRILSAAAYEERWRPVRFFRAMREQWKPLRQLLSVLLTAPCIPAAISAAFGQREGRCGCCSACRQGPLLGKTPPLPYLNERALRLWLLKWQRDALARRRGCRPEEIMDAELLHQAADSMRIPDLDDPEARAAMQRLMAAIVREYVHKKPVCGEE